VKLGKKTIVLMGLPLGLGVAAGVVFLVLLKPASAAPGVPDPAPGEHGVMVPLDTKVVNLAPGGDYKYAKVGVTLELRPDDPGFYALKSDARTTAEGLVVKDYADILPLLDDAVGKVVGSKTSTDLLTQGGRDALKTELIDAVRKVLDGGAAAAPAASGVVGASPAPPVASTVLELYFTDLVMQ
jgi:flagellar basal body-associated protein FliL